jgi:hypothetical protein
MCFVINVIVSMIASNPPPAPNTGVSPRGRREDRLTKAIIASPVANPKHRPTHVEEPPNRAMAENKPGSTPSSQRR